MIALDTNVLLRVIVADDAGQHARALAFLRSFNTGPGEEPRLFVAPVVLCELVWVLKTVFGRSRGEVAAILQGILDSRELLTGDRSAIEASLRAYREGRGGFADYFVRESSRRAGCESVATFEKALLKEEGFRAV